MLPKFRKNIIRAFGYLFHGFGYSCLRRFAQLYSIKLIKNYDSNKRICGTKCNRKIRTMNFERREIGHHDVQIEILYYGVCHTDIHFTRNEWSEGIFPMVPGHEIVGRIIAVGSHIKNHKIGDYTGVGTMVDSCRVCSDCTGGHENFCQEQTVYTYGALGKDGLPTYGGFSNTIVVNEDFALRISDKIDLAAAAPLLCAGITTLLSKNSLFSLPFVLDCQNPEQCINMMCNY